MFSKKIKLTEKELNAKLNRSYLRGYDSGYDLGYDLGYNSGVIDGIFRKYTPNQLRELLGLKTIDKKSGD